MYAIRSYYASPQAQLRLAPQPPASQPYPASNLQGTLLPPLPTPSATNLLLADPDEDETAEDSADLMVSPEEIT